MTDNNTKAGVDYQILLKSYLDRIPVNYHWVAQDANGNCWAYEVEPHQHCSGWYENEIGSLVFLFQGEPNAYWHETLQAVSAIRSR